jgi:hypothetical protein
VADVSNQGPPQWNHVGYQETLQLTPEWQQIHRVFRASETIPGRTRICFKFGGSDIDFALAGLSLRPGGQWIVLPEGQSLEAANVGIPVSGWSEAAMADAHQFMVDTEKDFIRDITDFLKNDLGVRVPITASQINYHSPEIVAQTCDYADIHAYWQHPRFPRRPWDPVDWTIGNTPMEASPDADALLAARPGGCSTDPSRSPNGTSRIRTIMRPAWYRLRRWWPRCRIGTACFSSSTRAAKATGTRTGFSGSSRSTAIPPNWLC